MSDKTDQIIENKKTTIKKLAILMMISDRHIHDNEYINVINVIKELSIWPPSDNEIKELVSSVSYERETQGLKELVKKYSRLIRNNADRKMTVNYLNDIMMADDEIDPQEELVLSTLREVWDI